MRTNTRFRFNVWLMLHSIDIGSDSQPKDPVHGAKSTESTPGELEWIPMMKLSNQIRPFCQRFAFNAAWAAANRAIGTR